MDGTVEQKPRLVLNVECGNENLSTPAEADLRSILEIPKSGAFRAPIPANVAVAWKPGGITGVSTAWGIIGLPGRPYALAMMVNYSTGGCGRGRDPACFRSCVRPFLAPRACHPLRYARAA